MDANELKQFSEALKNLARDCYDSQKQLTEKTFSDEIPKISMQTHNLTKQQVEFLIRDMHSSLNQIIDRHFDVFSAQNSPIYQDFLNLYQFIPKQNSTDSSINFNDMKLDSLTFFLFCQELFIDYSNSNNDKSQPEQYLGRSNIVQYIFLHSNELSLLHNFSEIANHINNAHHNTLKIDIKTDQFFQQCIQRSFTRNPLNNQDNNKDSMKQNILKSIDMPNEIPQLLEKINHQNSFLILYENLIHYKILLFHQDKTQNHKDDSLIHSHISMLIEKSIEFFNAASNSNKCTILSVAVQWKNVKKEKKIIIQIEYNDIKKHIQLEKNKSNDLQRFDFILPPFNTSNELVTINFYDENGVKKRRTIQYSLNQYREDESHKFDIQTQHIRSKDGTIHIQHKKYELTNQNYPTINPNISEENINDLLDFYISHLVRQWILQAMDKTVLIEYIYPPRQYYNLIVDLAIKYQIPASTIFVKITQKLYSFWCHSESYLNMLTVMLLASYSSLNNSNQIGPTESDKEIFGHIMKSLKFQVPLFLCHHLSKPLYYSHNCLFPLLILFPFALSNHNRLPELLETFIDESMKNIIISTISFCFSPKNQDSVAESEETNKLKGFISTLLIRQDLFLHSGQKTCIFEFPNNYDFSKHFDFSVGAVAKTMRLLSILTQRIFDYYNQTLFPHFLSDRFDKYDIHDKLLKFGGWLVKLFTNQHLADQEALNLKISHYINFFESYNNFYNNFDQTNQSSIICPAQLFDLLFRAWIRVRDDKMKQNMDNFVQNDTFEPTVRSKHLSISLQGMNELTQYQLDLLLTYFKSYTNDRQLDLFMILLDQLFRDYTEKMIIKIISFFPAEIYQDYRFKTLCINSSVLNMMPKQPFQMEPFFVTFNDILACIRFLIEKVNAIKAEFPNCQTTIIQDHASSCKNRIMEVLVLLSKYVAKSINDQFPDQYIVNSQSSRPKPFRLSISLMKPITIYQANERIHDFLYAAYEYFKKTFLDFLSTCHLRYKKQSMCAFLYGFDTGVMNKIITETKNSPMIDHHALIDICETLTTFYIEMGNDIFEGQDGIPFEMLPYFSLLKENIATPPQELIARISKEKNTSNALCLFIILSSYMCSENQDKYKSLKKPYGDIFHQYFNLTFRPPEDFINNT